MTTMSLKEIKASVKTVDREVEFRPLGKPTGWIFILRHASSREVQDVMTRFHARVRELALKRKTGAHQKLMEQHENSLRIAHVAGWRWEAGADEKKGRPEFSIQELKEILNDNGSFGWLVKDFIDDEVGTLEDFLSKSEAD